jgi:hypothetical protein
VVLSVDESRLHSTAYGGRVLDELTIALIKDEGHGAWRSVRALLQAEVYDLLALLRVLEP